MAEQRWIVNENGERVAVVLEIAEYNHMIADLEELDDLRAFDEAMASGEQPIPIEQAFAEIERKQ